MIVVVLVLFLQGLSSQGSLTVDKGLWEIKNYIIFQLVSSVPNNKIVFSKHKKLENKMLTQMEDKINFD
jgi:hypothetical protein